MRTFKKATAWILFALSVLGLVAVVAGLVGSWMVRNRVTEITLNLLTVGETVVTTTNDSLNRVDDRLEVSQQNIESIEGDIVSAGENLTENSLVGAVIRSNISEETSAAISEATATAVTIADTIHVLDEAVNTANQLPFVTLDGFVPTTISDVADGLVELQTKMTTFRTGVQERREAQISTSVGFLTDITTDITEGIDEVQAGMAVVDNDLAENAAKLAEAKVELPKRYTRITLAVNVALLLIAVAFGSLLVQSWAIAHNPDVTLKQLTAPGKTTEN